MREAISKYGRKLYSEKEIVEVTLPIGLNEKRSALERICDLWGTAPIYIKRAIQEKEPIE
jgi:hypothetical protein